MNTSDLVVEIRDIDLARVAQLTEADLSGLIAVPRQNAVGSWQLTLPDTVLDEATGEWVKHAAAQHLRKEGAGIVITALTPDAETVLSGPMTSATYAADETDLTGTWTFTGVSDLVLLADALAYPETTNADPDTQAASHDKRSGHAEDLLRQYVAHNIAATDAAPGRIVGLRRFLRLGGTSQARGPVLTKSARFDNLLELCQALAFQGGLNFDIVQNGPALEFVVSEPVDRTKTIRMDMANQLLKSVTYGYGAPSTTLAVVAGQGQGEARRIIARTSDDATTSETRWGRRVERFIDQRQTDDDAELIQKGDEEVLAGAASTTGLQAAPTDSDAMLYLRDWRTGDRISVVVEGQEVPAQVTEAALSVNGSTVVFVATLGDPAAFDVDAASDRRAAATSSRVSALERNAEGGGEGSGGASTWDELTDKPATFPPSDHSHTWDSVTGKPSTFAPAAHSHSWDSVTGKPSAFAPTAHGHGWTEITGKPASFPPATHGHDLTDASITGVLPVAQVPTLDIASKTSGALPASRLSGLTAYTSITDWNLATVPGFYFGGTGVANAPTGGYGWGDAAGQSDLVGTVRTTADGSIVQEVTGARADSTAIEVTWRRVRSGATWSAWAVVSGETIWDKVLAKPATFPPSAHSHTWDSVTGKPATFPPSTHGHALTDANITGILPVAQVPTLDIVSKTSGTIPASRVGGAAWADISGKPATFPATAHTHGLAEVNVTDLGTTANLNDYTTQGIYHQAANANAATGTNYPAPLAGLLEVYSRSSMTYQRYTVYDGRGHYERTRYTTTWYPWRFVTDTVPWDSVTGKPATFPATAHTHTAAQITDFSTAADARVAASHAAPLTPTGFALFGGGGGRNPNGLPGQTLIYVWTQPTGGAAVGRYEVWGQEAGVDAPVLVATSTTTEARIYDPGAWPDMTLTVRAVSTNGVAGAMSNAVAFTRFDPDLSATTSDKGIVRLATSAEALAGTDATKAVTPAALKTVADTKAASGHGHALTDANITGVLPVAQMPTVDLATKTSGTLPVAQVPTLDLATKTSGTLTVARGGTGATTAAAALTSLGAAAATHGHDLTAANITGVLPVAQVPTLDISTKTSGNLPASRVTGLADAASPTGVLMPYAGATAPSGWLLADGAEVSRTTYAALFTVVGTTYGAGNGSSTFNLPNLKGRVPVGLDAGQAEFDSRGETGGAKAHTLTVAEMPAHTHQALHRYLTPAEWTSKSPRVAAMENGYGPIVDSAGSTGGNQPHNNLQPYIVMNYIIKA